MSHPPKQLPDGWKEYGATHTLMETVRYLASIGTKVSPSTLLYISRRHGVNFIIKDARKIPADWRDQIPLLTARQASQLWGVTDRAIRSKCKRNGVKHLLEKDAKQIAIAATETWLLNVFIGKKGYRELTAADLITKSGKSAQDLAKPLSHAIKAGAVDQSKVHHVTIYALTEKGKQMHAALADHGTLSKE